MKNHAFSIILNDLQADLLHFIVFALIIGIMISLFIAGAKLLELKEMNPETSFLAILPLFWLFLVFFDPKPEKVRLLTRRFSLIFGTLSLMLIIFIIRII